MKDGYAEDDDGTLQFRLRFEKADRDKDGLISYQELKRLIESFKYPCSDAELQDYVNEVDINENGEVNVDAFLDIISIIQNGIEEKNNSKNEIIEAFKIFDKNNTGLLTPKNVFDIFKQIDQTIQEEEVLQMFKECDLDRDGYLNYEEFSRMVINK